jgi:hypothetical protein
VQDDGAGGRLVSGVGKQPLMEDGHRNGGGHAGGKVSA